MIIIMTAGSYMYKVWKTYNDEEYIDLQVDQTNVADTHNNEQ